MLKIAGPNVVESAVLVEQDEKVLDIAQLVGPRGNEEREEEEEERGEFSHHFWYPRFEKKTPSSESERS